MPRKKNRNISNIIIKKLSGRSGSVLFVSIFSICAVAVTCSLYAVYTINNLTAEAFAFTPKVAYLENTESDFPKETQLQYIYETEQTNNDENETENTDDNSIIPLNSIPVICIDPGHGYDDPGTDSDFLGDKSEKDITLDISLRVGKLLSGYGYTVVYTREDDIIPEDGKKSENDLYLMSPYKREDILKSFDYVNAFVSIHCNSYPQDPDIEGCIIYYYKDNSKNIDLFASDVAFSIEDSLNLKSGEDVLPSTVSLGYNDAYYVTKCSFIPSLLVECGFITNENDAKNLLDPDWCQKMAEGIADGIKKFVK